MLSWLPEDVSTYGQHIDALFYGIYYLTGATFFLVEILLVWFLIKYRARPGRRAIYSHGNTTLEIIWTIVPAVILVVLGIISNHWWVVIRGPAPEPNYHVEVTGKQFNWEIRYSGPDAEFDTEDDFKLDNEMHIPVDTVIRVTLKSKDVIHSFFLPNLRFKQDAVPGRSIEVWFEATKVGSSRAPSTTE